MRSFALKNDAAHDDSEICRRGFAAFSVIDVDEILFESLQDFAVLLLEE